MLTATVCEREIRELHAFFVEYYAGERDDFDRLEGALGERFELIHPRGETASRDAVLDGIRDTYDTYEPGTFDIEIHDVEPIEILDERALVRYEEWQTSPDGTTGRLSTVYFAAPETGTDSPPHAEWRHLQETWLDAPER